MAHILLSVPELDHVEPDTQFTVSPSLTERRWRVEARNLLGVTYAGTAYVVRLGADLESIPPGGSTTIRFADVEDGGDE